MKKLWLICFLMCGVVIFSGCTEKVERVANNFDKISNDAKPIIVAVQDQASQENTDDTEALIRIIDAGVKASSPWNPYAAVISAGLGLVTLILGSSLRTKNRALAEVVTGNETIKEYIPEEFKTAQNSAQSIDTQKIVTKIRRDLEV